MQLHAPHDGFHVLGWAKDAQQVMAQARVCLAPLRFGAGLKGKLADAMACGTPSVTTTIGCEGMHGDLPWGGAVANTVEAIVTAAVDLYQNEAVWYLAQSRGTTILQKHFCRETSARTLVAQLLTARTEQSQRRQRNFIGSMLRHHAHKSTQYMSQWITEKNKNQTGAVLAIQN
jgi:O-antigen biosynthesis protein